MDEEAWQPNWSLTDAVNHLHAQAADLANRFAGGEVEAAEQIAKQLASLRAPIRLRPRGEQSAQGDQQTARAARHPTGAAVEYWSQSAGGWIPAVVQGYDERLDVYQLNVQPVAVPQKVRARPTGADGKGAAAASPTAAVPAAAPPAAARAAAAAAAAPPPEPVAGPPVATPPAVVSAAASGYPGGNLPKPAAGSEYPVGSTVEYFSNTHGGWLPAVVQGFDSKTGAYILDIQPIAFPNKVRRPPEQASAATPSSLGDDSNVRRRPTGLPSAEPARKDEPRKDSQSAKQEGARQTSAAAGEAPNAEHLPASAQGDSATGSKSAANDIAPPGDLAGSLQASPSAAAMPLRPRRSCSSCQVSLPVDELLGPECEHLFCESCLRGHVMKQDFLRQRVSCPSCACLLTPEQVRHAVGEHAYAERQAEMAREDEEMARRMAEAVGAGGDGGPGGAGGADEQAPADPSEARRMGHLLGDAVRPVTAAPRPKQLSRRQSSAANPAAAAENAAEFCGAEASQRRQHRARCATCQAERALDEMLGPSCEHLFCPPCLRVYVLASDFVRETVKCPAQNCHTELTEHQIQHIVGEVDYKRRRAAVDEEAAQALMAEFAREEAAEQARVAQQNNFRCPLCFDDGRRDDAIELDCEHRFCVDCFRNYLSSKISEAQVADDELVCPIPDCKTEITVSQVEGGTAGTPLWDKFLQFRAIIWQPGSGDGKIIACPTPDCERFVVDSRLEVVKCHRCKKEFCPKCGQDTHKGSTCEAFKAWKQENEAGDKHFEELMAKEQWRRCPVCGMPSERESGCNFMQCRSDKCRKKTYWCYICGKKMNKEDHYSHYQRGPYEDECKTPLDQHVPMAAGPSVAQATAEDGSVIGAISNWFGAMPHVIGAR